MQGKQNAPALLLLLLLLLTSVPGTRAQSAPAMARSATAYGAEYSVFTQSLGADKVAGACVVPGSADVYDKQAVLFSSATVTDSVHVVLVGSVSDDAFGYTTYTSDPVTGSSASGDDAFAMRVRADGSTVWARRLAASPGAGDTREQAFDCVVVQDMVYVVGTTDSSSVLDGEDATFTASKVDCLLAELALGTGALQRVTRHGADGDDVCRIIMHYPGDDSLLLFGHSDSTTLSGTNMSDERYLSIRVPRNSWNTLDFAAYAKCKPFSDCSMPTLYDAAAVQDERYAWILSSGYEYDVGMNRTAESTAGVLLLDMSSDSPLAPTLVTSVTDVDYTGLDVRVMAPVLDAARGKLYFLRNAVASPTDGRVDLVSMTVDASATTADVDRAVLLVQVSDTTSRDLGCTGMVMDVPKDLLYIVCGAGSGSVLLKTLRADTLDLVEESLVLTDTMMDAVLTTRLVRSGASDPHLASLLLLVGFTDQRAEPGAYANASQDPFNIARDAVFAFVPGTGRLAPDATDWLVYLLIGLGGVAGLAGIAALVIMGTRRRRRTGYRKTFGLT